ncbi:hypothetical protein ACJJTC_003661 [Scirpophaga incertulas]
MAARLAGWWREMLRKRPVATNTVVYATFYTGAELSQQTFNSLYAPEKPELDLTAAARIVVAGSAVYPTPLYFWYRYLDKKFVGTAVKTVATKVAADQFIATPILLAAFYTLSGVLERREDVFEELRAKYWKTFVANQAFWIPSQTINFFFVPSHLRVVYVASVSFIWINVLCFIKRQKCDVVVEKSFDVFWSLEDDATINVFGVIESDCSETLVDNIRLKLTSVINKAGVDKIFFRRFEEYGFYYWRKYSSTDIRKYVELLDIPNKRLLTRRDLENILSEVSYQSLPYNNEGLFKIFVTKQRVENPYKTRGEYGIIFIIHHSVGDGVALLEFLCKILADNIENKSVNMFSIPEPRHYDSPHALMDMMKKLCHIPVCFIDNILRDPDVNDLHGPPLVGIKSFKWTESDENLLKMIKEIKENIDNVTFSDVLATALSGGMHNYFTQTKGYVPEGLGVILPVRFPKMTSENNDHRFFKNDFSVTILDLPLRERSNFKIIKQKCDELRISADPLSNHYFIKLVSIFPKQILQSILKSSQATLVFSNMPGPSLQTICGGNVLKELVFFVPHKGNTGE